MLHVRPQTVNPSPRPPLASAPGPPGAAVELEHRVLVTFTATGNVDEFDAAAQQVLRQRIAQLAGTEPHQVELSIEAASVRVHATITVRDASESSLASSSLSSSLADVQAASAALGITCESVPTVQATVQRRIVSGSPTPPPSREVNPTRSSLLMIGILVGGIATTLLLALACICALRRRRAAIQSSLVGAAVVSSGGEREHGNRKAKQIPPHDHHRKPRVHTTL